MEAPKNLTKLYYTMGEVSEMFDVNPSLIRYWDKEFKALKLKKNKKGDRRFTVKDIELIAEIYTLVKERGFTIDGAKTELFKLINGSHKSSQKNSLLALKHQLEGLKLKLLKLRENIA